ncbi:hypothetical protein GEMRC1_013331 [Eukaryota sp. GEM-RC1]
MSLPQLPQVLHQGNQTDGRRTVPVFDRGHFNIEAIYCTCSSTDDVIISSFLHDFCLADVPESLFCILDVEIDQKGKSKFSTINLSNIAFVLSITIISNQLCRSLLEFLKNKKRTFLWTRKPKYFDLFYKTFKLKRPRVFYYFDLLKNFTLRNLSHSNSIEAETCIDHHVISTSIGLLPVTLSNSNDGLCQSLITFSIAYTMFLKSNVIPSDLSLPSSMQGSWIITHSQSNVQSNLSKSIIYTPFLKTSFENYHKLCRGVQFLFSNILTLIYHHCRECGSYQGPFDDELCCCGQNCQNLKFTAVCRNHHVFPFPFELHNHLLCGQPRISEGYQCLICNRQTLGKKPGMLFSHLIEYNCAPKLVREILNSTMVTEKQNSGEIFKKVEKLFGNN